MAYALESLLKIRAMREDRTGTELVGARRARAAAEKVYDEKTLARQQFEATSEQRREKIYDTVMTRIVTRDELERVREAVTQIDEEGVLLAKSEHEAKTVFETRDRETQEAKTRYTVAVKNKSKIDQHRLAWEVEDRKLQEMLADSEMDEFTGRRLVSDDDDTFD